MISKQECLSEHSLDSGMTVYDTEAEYYTASEYDDAESNSLSSVEQTLTTKEKKKKHLHMRTYDVLELRTHAW